jgi:hypothetical protein
MGWRWWRIRPKRKIERLSREVALGNRQIPPWLSNNGETNGI